MRNGKGESQREGSYFCSGFGRGESVKRLERRRKLGNEEWIFPMAQE